jgi:5-formyltetrahydrofolate cyclo-ligase
MPQPPAPLKDWRKAQREKLIAARMALPAATLDAFRQRIDANLELSFPGLARCRLAFCWPIKGEYDARHFARTMRDRGALTALPVVVAAKKPLVFREWHPGVVLATGALDIP